MDISGGIVHKKVYLSDAIDQFMQHSAAQGLARNTIRNRRATMNHALSCWGNLPVANIEPRHVDLLFSSRNWNAATRNNYLSQLRLFFKWCRNHKILGRDDDPTATWSKQKEESKEKLRVPVDRFDELLEAAGTPLDRMIIALGLYLFVRGSEITSMKISDDRGEEFRIIRHKTKQISYLPVCLELRQELDRWKTEYARLIGGPPQSEHYLIPRRMPPGVAGEFENMQSFRPNVLAGVYPDRPFLTPYHAVKRTLKAIGFETFGSGVHTLRRSGARAMFDSLRAEGTDGALLRVQSMLSHADPKVTTRYIGLELEREQLKHLFAGKPMFRKTPTQDAAVIDASTRFGA